MVEYEPSIIHGNPWPPGGQAVHARHRREAPRLHAARGGRRVRRAAPVPQPTAQPAAQPAAPVIRDRKQGTKRKGQQKVIYNGWFH